MYETVICNSFFAVGTDYAWSKLINSEGLRRYKNVRNNENSLNNYFLKAAEIEIIIESLFCHF